MAASISSVPLPPRCDVVVVGAGLAGLSCARHLKAGGASVHVVEAEPEVGGRVRTDVVDGFRIDRGFQVLLTAYDEVWHLVDPEELRLGTFDSGSLIWTEGELHLLADPFRSPSALAGALRAPVGSLGDKLKVAKLRAELATMSDATAMDGPPHSAMTELRRRGFGQDFIDTFFRPFLGGVFLDRSLSVPASLFRYLFRCFATGDATIPAGGMGRLSEAIAAPLNGQVTLGVSVSEVDATSVTTTAGAGLEADHVVLATDAFDAARLSSQPSPEWAGTVNGWFAAPRPPVEQPVLVLDGAGEGPVNHLAVVSQVAADLAPEGWSLISAAGVGEATEDPAGFAEKAREQLSRWFGDEVRQWRHLHTHHVPRALPQRDPTTPLDAKPLRDERGVFLAGDDREFAAIQGALRSGRRVAEAILGGRDP